jgi:hypothetical protein
MGIADKLKSPEGRILISIVLGLGLATVFRQTCSEGRCLVFKSPTGINGKTYAIEDACYRYEKYATKC